MGGYDGGMVGGGGGLEGRVEVDSGSWVGDKEGAEMCRFWEMIFFMSFCNIAYIQ